MTIAAAPKRSGATQAGLAACGARFAAPTRRSPSAPDSSPWNLFQLARYPAKFRNECLGLPSFLGDHFVTREEVESCCTPRAMAKSFHDEIWCETAEYDDHHRSITYMHPETQPDDTLHAINYATALARLALDRRLRQSRAIMDKQPSRQ